MRHAVRRAVLACAALLAAGLAVPATAAPAAAAPAGSSVPVALPTTRAPVAALVAAPAVVRAAARPVTVRGTYARLAKDHLTAAGDLVHEYEDVLRVPGRAIPLRLRRGHGLTPGSRVRVSALREGEALEVSSAQRLAPAERQPHGVTSLIVLLAYWTKPDALTPARAHEQFFGDAHTWLKEVSYGHAGLTGVVTPWLRIPAPAGGRCYAGAETILANARKKADLLGGKYAPYQYQRTVVYFPRCSGGDTAGVAGWAYEPGDVSWLNGHLDRRTAVHEQGHNYGMGHARSLACTSPRGARVTFSTSCTSAVYGDPFDAMGRSAYAAHFTGYRKDAVGWLGSRKRVLTTASATFTLPPFEKPSTLPLVVVAHSGRVAGRSYWLEYRRPVGMDARLPAGATGGVLVHLQEPRRPGWLLDPSPRDGTFTTAVVKTGTSWTAPDYVRISVGSISSTGARVTVTGARPAPTVPSAPRSLVLTAGDAVATLSWTRPSSDGRSPVTGYRAVLTAPHGKRYERAVLGETTSLTVDGLPNGVTYRVQVYARNAVGLSLPVTGSVAPYAMLPSVQVTSPAPGAELAGTVALSATAARHPVSQQAVRCVTLFIDDVARGSECGTSVATASVSTYELPNGPHRVHATVSDANGRLGRSQTVDVTTRNPVPEGAWVTPADGAVVDADTLPLEVSASVPVDPAVGIREVRFSTVANGWEHPIGSVGSYYGGAIQPPYRVNWDVRHVLGKRTVQAVVIGTNGRWTRLPPREVTVEHPPATVVVTAPAAGSTVTGTTALLTADATVTAAGSAVSRVAFSVNGSVVGTDWTAPYEAPWDISAVSGMRWIDATVYETSGRVYHAAPVTVTVGNVLPVTSIDFPRHSATVGPVPHTLSGVARAGAGGEAPDRVSVTMDGAAVATVTPSADGRWSLPWDAAGRFGGHWLRVVATTPGGLVAHATTYFEVVHPRPVVTQESPAAPAVLLGGATTEFVLTAVPGQDDPETVRRVCVVVSVLPRSCVTPGADGKFRAPVTADHTSGEYYTNVTVEMSDGYVHWLGWPYTKIARPPGPPGVAVTAGRGALTLAITRPTAYEPIGVTEYVVTVGDRVTRVTGSPATVTGLTDGVLYDVSVRAVNAVGTGPPTVATGRPGVPTSLGTTAAPPRHVGYGSEVTFAGRLLDENGALLPGEAVAFDVCDGTVCTEAAAGVTGADGIATVTATVGAATALRLRYDGDEKHASSTVSVPVTVVPKAVLTLSADTVPYSGSVTLTGTVTPARGGHAYIQHRTGTSTYWYSSYLRLDATGTATVTWNASHLGTGTHTLRLYFYDSATSREVHSAEQTLTVTS